MAKTVFSNREFLFDSRIVNRNIRDGRLERGDYDNHLSSLPDLEKQSEDIGEEIYGANKPGLALTGEFSSEQDEE